MSLSLPVSATPAVTGFPLATFLLLKWPFDPVHPTLSKAYPLEDTGQAALDVHRNAHQGKVGVLCLAPEEGLGVRDPEKRATYLDAINRFRGV